MGKEQAEFGLEKCCSKHALFEETTSYFLLTLKMLGG